MRGDGRPSLRSVDSEIKRCVIEPRNFLVVSLRLWQSRGPSQALATPGPTGVPGHTGVGETWRMIARVLRERGKPSPALGRYFRRTVPPSSLTKMLSIRSSARNCPSAVLDGTRRSKCSRVQRTRRRWPGTAECGVRSADPPRDGVTARRVVS